MCFNLDTEESRDEINRLEPGKNYGWSVISYGTPYAGTKIGEGTHKAGMEQPVHYWLPCPPLVHRSLPLAAWARSAG